MRALADYIMRGRIQAVLIAILGIPVISHSVLALVTLRRGTWEGFSLLVWSFAPFLFFLWGDWQLLPLALGSLGALATVFLGSCCLRSGLPWPITVILITAVSAMFGILFLLVFGQQITDTLQQFVELQKTAIEAQGQTVDPARLLLLSNKQAVGGLVFGFAVNCILALVVGRWWQALLYNPGGFRQEFSQFRLSPLMAGICGIILFFCGWFAEYREWAWVAGLPFILVSIAVAHQFAAVQKMGYTWLVVFYIALVNLPFYLAMAALGFADAWMDLRKNLLPKKE